jgi:hypothetical protein
MLIHNVRLMSAFRGKSEVRVGQFDFRCGPKADIDCLDTPRIWRCTAQRLSITKSRK